MCGRDGAEFGGVKKKITLQNMFHHYLHHLNTHTLACTAPPTPPPPPPPPPFDLTSHWSSLLPCQILRLHLAGLTKITIEECYLFNSRSRSRCQCTHCGYKRLIPDQRWSRTIQSADFHVSDMVLIRRITLDGFLRKRHEQEIRTGNKLQQVKNKQKKSTHKVVSQDIFLCSLLLKCQGDVLYLFWNKCVL